MMQNKPIDNSDFLASLDSLLSHMRNSRRARPDIFALLPFIRDVVFEEVVIHCRDNQAKAARMLEVNRNTLRTHMWRIQKEKSLTN